MENLNNLTPAMKQYVEVKQKYPDCLVMFRMGDFYEMFYDDAVTASRELEITLTSRGKDEKKAPLAGVPYHAIEQYLARLVRKGYKIVIVEQVEDPKLAKGLVKRDVVRIVTPGTVMESSMLDAKSNNYIASLNVNDTRYSMSLCDISTGEFLSLISKERKMLNADLAKHMPSECIIPASLGVDIELNASLQKLGIFITRYDDRHFSSDSCVRKIQQHFNVITISGLGIDNEALQVGSVGSLLKYIEETQFSNMPHIAGIKVIRETNNMALDISTIRNLELVQNVRDSSNKGTLLSVLDNTLTPMGARLLRKWILEPLMDISEINRRLNAVDVIKKNSIARESLQIILKRISDIERLISRINYGNAMPRDLLALKLSLSQISQLRTELLPVISRILESQEPNMLRGIYTFDDFSVPIDLIESSIREDALNTVREGNIIKPDFNLELKKLHSIKHGGRGFIAALEEKERTATGIKGLKIGFNNVFGYYIEVTKLNQHLVPQHYIRKQTTANSERYITEELKEQESIILSSDEKIRQLEFDIFVSILKKLSDFTAKIQDASLKIAKLDVIVSFANVAILNNYCKPIMENSGKIELIESRHPVIEQLEKGYVANDLKIDPNVIMVITGPNMSGKCLTGDSMVYSNKGMLPINYFKMNNSKEESFSKLKLKINGIKGNEYTSHFYYDGKRNTIKVTTRFGYEIEGTANHPVLVRTKEGMELWRKLGEIEKEDCIIINRNIDLWGGKINIPKEILNELYNFKYHHNVKKYKCPNILDEDIAYVIGLLIGDGTLTYKNGFTLSNADKEIVDEFSRIMNDKFGYIPKKKKNKPDYQVTSLWIRIFLEKIGLGHANALKKEVPYSILQAPKRIVKAFLQGLFDTDGDTVKKYGNASLSSSSYKLAKQIQLIFLNFGIVSSLKEKKTNRNKNYRVQVYGENAILFHKVIGFRLSRKKIRKDLASKLRMPNYGIPYLNQLLKDVQRRIVNKKNKAIALKKVKEINSIFYTYLPKNSNISYNKLNELINYCKLNKVNCQELEGIFNNYYLYEPIVKITNSNELKDVYDFSVPKTHSFTANGLINHNSSLMRQVALNVLMAQAGSFIAASEARIGVVDRIFTRVGAHDDLYSGQSTFMVEMMETANILNNATANSLIILDEIGRGTSTFDGVAIAWSVAEHIYNRIKAKTLFATHYHVLNRLASSFENIKNCNIAVMETGDEIIFLRKIVDGSTDKSYGIHVAKLAGIPKEVIERAKEIQSGFEADDTMGKKVKGKKAVLQKRLNEV